MRGRVKIRESEREGLRLGEGLSLNPPPFSHALISIFEFLDTNFKHKQDEARKSC